MTELERLASALLTQWRTEGGADDASIVVSAVLDRVLPYRVARRILGIDASEDYEALMLRLLAEDESLVRVEPVDAADMARATVNSRLPDLDALQLLRAATVTFDSRALARLGDAAPTDRSRDESKWATPPAAKDEDAVPPPPPVPVDEPSTRKKAKGAAPDAAVSSRATAPQRGAGVEGCWSCSEALPADRPVKFCPFCGADQREPACSGCGASAERGWKHCAECGATL